MHRKSIIMKALLYCAIALMISGTALSCAGHTPPPKPPHPKHGELPPPPPAPPKPPGT